MAKQTKWNKETLKNYEMTERRQLFLEHKGAGSKAAELCTAFTLLPYTTFVPIEDANYFSLTYISKC